MSATWDAARVRALRQRLDMPQLAFACLLGVGQNTVSRWECAHSRPSGAVVRLLEMAERGELTCT